ncbi:MAG TPA: DUF2017 domain-containing protein [Nocardioides sp.]|uniref:DUF2017 domain-containing protein n=1 Tax=Nocardioides sp. TaxID=35761 RepID=UPI002D7E2CC2|nr:DUF2017 domain-containing protein [Nocardioides sp.]HET6654478.1 DUF2017 domain-containing protein [Nocardioides sp.]
MSGGFEPRRGGGAVATFTGFEADLLRSLASQLVELLRNEVAAPTGSNDPLEQLLDFSGPTTEPDDPVLARLFPTAYPDDPEAAGEFRRFTEGGLRDAKARSAVLIIDTLEQAGLPHELAEDGLHVDVELTREEATTWMRSFTDVRLALATRLGVEEGDEDFWMSLDDEDPRTHVHDIYEWVGYLQETLVASLAR